MSKEVGHKANVGNDDDDDADDGYVEKVDATHEKSTNIESIRSKLLSKKSDPKRSESKSKKRQDADDDADDADGDALNFDRKASNDPKRAEILREIKALKKDLKAATEEPRKKVEDEKDGRKRKKSTADDDEEGSSNALMKSLKEDKVSFLSLARSQGSFLKIGQGEPRLLFVQKLLVASRIRTQIVEVEGEDADH